MAITLIVRGGPMNGQRFSADIGWPPPDRLYGPDIHHSMIGTYELKTLYQAEHIAEYALRADGNFRQILAAWIMIRAERAMAKEKT